MKTTTSEKRNEFLENYSSKIEPIYIPIPEFKFYHGASDEEKVDQKFIGRERIAKQLKSWLTDGSTKTGTYLITGFRGMGKSSFVGKVLFDVTSKTSIKDNIILKAICFISNIFIIIRLLYFLPKNNHSIDYLYNFINFSLFWCIIIPKAA